MKTKKKDLRGLTTQSVHPFDPRPKKNPPNLAPTLTSQINPSPPNAHGSKNHTPARKPPTANEKTSPISIIHKSTNTTPLLSLPTSPIPPTQTKNLTYQLLFNISIQCTTNLNRSRALRIGNSRALSCSSIGSTSATQNEKLLASVGIDPYVSRRRCTTHGAVPSWI